MSWNCFAVQGRTGQDNCRRIFEDYVNKAGSGQAGVPITYYLKDITRAQLAKLWMAKYFPSIGAVIQPLPT